MQITKELLIHWWLHYSKTEYTSEDFNDFIALIDKYGTNLVFDIATASYMFDDGTPYALLYCIRNNNIKDFFNAFLAPTPKHQLEEELIVFSKKRKEFYYILVLSLSSMSKSNEKV